MIKETIEYYDKVVQSGPVYTTKTKLIREEELSAETLTELHIKFYKLNNSLRYCNGSYYKFKDDKAKTKYKDWLNSDEYEKISFQLYYGGGIVD